MDKMQIYNGHKQVPDNAKKPIQAGRLKGLTDINPMFRIKSLTEDFGACGIGWYYEITKQWIEPCGNESVAFTNIALYINVDGQWSKPIIGTGGSKIISMERNGAYVSDEAFKMSLTDALSVACKQLGYGADVYWNGDASKYMDVTRTPSSSDNYAQDEANNKRMMESVNQDLVPHGEGMTPMRLKRLAKAMEFTGKNKATVLATAKVHSFEEMPEETYIAIMNLFYNLMKPEQIKEVESIN